MKNFGAIKLGDLAKYMAILVFQFVWFIVVLWLNDAVYWELDVLGSWIAIGIVGVLVNVFLGIIIEGTKKILKCRKEHEVKFDDFKYEPLTKEELEEMFTL